MKYSIALSLLCIVSLTRAQVEVSFPTLGHLFEKPSEVVLTIAAKEAVEVRYTLFNHRHETVEAGTLKLMAQGQELRFKATLVRRYYLLEIKQGGKAKYCSFAVVPSFAPAKRAESPFGVMTHFAQNMPIDVLTPLVWYLLSFFTLVLIH